MWKRNVIDSDRLNVLQEVQSRQLNVLAKVRTLPEYRLLDQKCEVKLRDELAQ